MADVLRMEPPTKPSIQHYPGERRYTKWGLGASLFAHVAVVVGILILAWLNHIKTLRDLMMSPSLNTPPPPEIEVILIPDETPPPPTDHPLFIKQILQAPKPPPPIIKPKPKPVPKPPHPVIAKTQSHVETHAPESALVVGSGNFPKPTYPFQARQHGQQGTVRVTIVFDSSGTASSVQIVGSSGYGILDSAARSGILENWRDASFAGQTVTVPIVFNLNQP